LNKSHPSKKYTLALDIGAGEHYFIRLTGNWKSAGIVMFVDPQVERVDCRTASQENVRTSITIDIVADNPVHESSTLGVL
jgi:hypothetical protein